MMRRIVVAGLAVAAAAAAAYTYYSTDDFSNGMDPGKWQTNGTLGVSGGLLTTADANGGSIISTENVPDGTSEYEAKMTLKLASSGGSYVAYLRASSNARLAPSGSTGTFYAFEIQSPTITASGCSATLKGYKVVNGVSTLLIMSGISCRDGMVIRTIARGSYMLAWIDNMRYGMIDTDIVAGKAGAGVYGAPAGNGASVIQLGAADRTAPWQVNAGTVATSVYPNFVDMQWQPPQDPDGVGVAYFYVSRAGGGFEHLLQPSALTDATVAAATTYTYSLSRSISTRTGLLP